MSSPKFCSLTSRDMRVVGGLHHTERLARAQRLEYIVMFHEALHFVYMTL